MIDVTHDHHGDEFDDLVIDVQDSFTFTTAGDKPLFRTEGPEA